MWRDRRDMLFGAYQEDLVRQAIREDCSGFVLYLTEQALFGGSGFIPDIEMRAMANRRERDPAFLNGAVFRGWDIDKATSAAHEKTGISLGSTLGQPLVGADLGPSDLRETANAILIGYLSSQRSVGPAEILLDTRNHLSWQQPGLLHVGWHKPLAHDIDDCAPDCWEQHLQPALHDLRCALLATGSDRDLVVRGTPHLSAALALGFEFRRPTGWNIEMHDAYGGTWTTGYTGPDDAGWRFDPRPGAAGASDTLVVAVHARHDIGDALRAHRASFRPARATLHVRPPADAAAESIDPAAASSLAAAIAEQVRMAQRDYGTRETHLYLAGPWPMATLLGWHLASSGPVTSFEATADRHDYRPACRLI